MSAKGGRFVSEIDDIEPLTTGYLGIELPCDRGVQYGWVGFSTDLDGGVVIRNFSVETELGRWIRVGATGEEQNLDFDGDGRLDVSDLDLLTEALTRDSPETHFDINNDGQISELDLNHWLVTAAVQNGFDAAYRLGDANLDGRVDATDLNRIGSNWLQDMSGWSNGDFAPNGRIDAADLNSLAINWRQRSLPDGAASVPEPSALPLTLVGLALVLRRARSQRN